MIREEFIRKFTDIAIRNYSKEKIIPSLVVAQAILESGYGTSELSVKACNYFGLNNYHDEVTREYGTYKMLAPQEVNGTWVYNEEEFCKFDTVEQCCECLYKWYNRSKYKDLHTITQFEKACKFVQSKGYATDSQYANKLIKIIYEHKLYEYDNLVLDKHGYYVQIGYFENYDRALAMRDRAIELGFKDCFIKEGNKI